MPCCADEETVECKVYPSQTVLDMKKTLKADAYEMDTFSSDGIQSKKAQCSSTRRYKVFRDGKQIEDHMTLQDNGISDGETLHLKQVLQLLITIVETSREGIPY